MDGMLDTYGSRGAARNEAEVRADGVTTRYLRAGSGAPVLLLCDTCDARFDVLVDALATRHRVIAPLEATCVDETRAVVSRLTAFLDGLGLGSMPVVGAGIAAGPAAALARLHPERIGRMVLLGEPEGDAAGHAAAALAALRRD